MRFRCKVASILINAIIKRKSRRKSFKCIQSGAEIFGFRNFVLRTSLSFSFPLTTKISQGYRLFYIFKDYRNVFTLHICNPLVFLNISQGKSQHNYIQDSIHLPILTRFKAKILQILKWYFPDIVMNFVDTFGSCLLLCSCGFVQDFAVQHNGHGTPLLFFVAYNSLFKAEYFKMTKNFISGNFFFFFSEKKNSRRKKSSRRS